MATTSILEITSPSSSPPITWDVFLSFYGDDTRENFASHLYSALDHAGIVTFIDDPALEKGQQILTGLLSAINDSKICVVIISENYARSPWCLDELVEILTCKKTENQVVPVFYYVDPSDVRHRKGSFGDALDYHEKRYSCDMINKWKSALAQIAVVSGYHLKKHANENESKTIQSIVENIARQVTAKALHLGGDLFGIDSAIEEIYQKLRTESNDVRVIGICGMGGIGKTTTAKAFYNKYYSNFDSCCFIENVKQYSQGGSPLLPLLQQLLTALGSKNYKVPDVDSGIRQLKKNFRFKKALVVLDDPDQSSCLEFLASHCNLFSAGSRIVITTRDVNLLNQLKVDISEVDVYMVNKLGQTHSLELFNYHAFGKPMSHANLTAAQRELSVSFVSYAGGLPLALKVLGSSLRGRTHDELFWKVKLEKVREIPENEILEILQLSYNDLSDETVKSIFLDIAFFFIGKHQYEAVEIFKSCNFFPEVGIQILLERCLLTIDENNMLQMHDLIQVMGRKIAKKTRLFLQENAGEGLENLEETDKIEGLILDLRQSKDKQINSQIFERLPKLRLLELLNVQVIKGRFKNSFKELRCIRWSYCMWTRLPYSFQPRKLISIHMRFSNFKRLWDNDMPFTSLKIINVEYSVNLKTTPDFGNSKSVEALYFRGCEGLLRVHPSIKELTGLYVLDLTECMHLKDLVYTYSGGNPLEPIKECPKMSYLILGHCRDLRRLPMQLSDNKWLKELDASYTAIEELPDSITQLKELVYLKLDGCQKLKKLPEQIGNMEGLRTFSASYTAIKKLPDTFAGLIYLERLDLRCCKNLRNLPNNIWKLKLLQVLDMNWCSKLEQLPNKLGKMQCLEELYASSTAIEGVPVSIELLSRLSVLDLSDCRKLEYPPNSVWNLASLTELYLSHMYVGPINLAAKVKCTKLVALALKCNIRLWLPMILSFSSLKRLILSDGGQTLLLTKPFSLSRLYYLQYLALYNFTNNRSSFPELPVNIKYLFLFSDATLLHLPDLSSLKKLKKLEIYNYISLESLPPLPPHLQSLTVYDCPSLYDVSDMSLLKELSVLQFGRCNKLKSVGSKKSVLQVVDVRKRFLPVDKAEVPIIAEWFSYPSSGRTISFDIPPLLGDNFLGLSLSVLLRCKGPDHSFRIRVAVTNITYGTIKYCLIPVYITGAEVYFVVKCLSGDEISIRSGDRVKILLQRQLFNIRGQEVAYEGVKVQMFAAYVIQRTLSTPDFPSVLNNLIN